MIGPLSLTTVYFLIGATWVLIGLWVFWPRARQDEGMTHLIKDGIIVDPAGNRVYSQSDGWTCPKCRRSASTVRPVCPTCGLIAKGA